MSSVLIKSGISEREDETLFEVKEGETHLGVGAPDKSLLVYALSLFKESTLKRLENPENVGYILQYGASRGNGVFLKELADWLAAGYAVHAVKGEEVYAGVKKGELFLTSGATSGLVVAANLFVKNKGIKVKVVLMEDPVYFLAGKVFDDCGYSKVPVKSEHLRGIDLKDLEDKLKEVTGKTQAKEKERSKRRKLENGQGEKKDGEDGEDGEDDVADSSNADPLNYACLIYLVPTHSNPTSITISKEKRLKLIELARKYHALIICDDVYELLTYTDEGMPPRMVALDQGEPEQPPCVISNGSFSKIFGPGVRLGWIEARTPLVNALAESGIAASGGSLNQLTSCLVLEMIRSGNQQTLLNHLKSQYSQRVKAVAQTLKEEMPSGVSFETPKGGFFFWVKLPDGILATDLLAICQKKDKIGFQPGNWSSIVGDYKNYMRLSIGHYQQDILINAVKKIAHHLKTLMGQN